MSDWAKWRISCSVMIDNVLTKIKCQVVEFYWIPTVAYLCNRFLLFKYSFSTCAFCITLYRLPPKMRACTLNIFTSWKISGYNSMSLCPIYLCIAGNTCSGLLWARTAHLLFLYRTYCTFVVFSSRNSWTRTRFNSIFCAPAFYGGLLQIPVVDT